jgi:hypothetical protein
MLRWRLSSICTNRYSTDDLIRPHDSVRVVRMLYGICIDPILRCFVDPKGLSYGDLLVGVVPDLMSWLTIWD